MRLFQTWKGKLFTGSLFFHKWVLKKYGLDMFFAYYNKTKLNDYEPRSATLELASREIYRYHIEGAVAEAGVYQGAFAKEINRYFPDRKLYLFDTFKGFDKRDTDVDQKEDFSSANADFSKTSVEAVLSIMEHPENCIIKKGWFPDTTEAVEDKFCFVSLDMDLYAPIKAGLEFFYPRLVHGGVIMVHDFGNEDYKGVRKAVEEFCEKNNTWYVRISDAIGSVVIVR